MDFSIEINKESLTNIIRGNLVSYYNYPLTSELIDAISKQISETVQDFFNDKLVKD